MRTDMSKCTYCNNRGSYVAVFPPGKDQRTVCGCPAGKKKKLISLYSLCIKQALKDGGPYWNQVVTMSLRMVAKEYGNKEANKLIDKHNLEDLGFSKVAI